LRPRSRGRHFHGGAARVQGRHDPGNNIVQTVASAAGTLSAIIFVLPGLVIIGWWTGFPYWTSASICALGGVLGVMYSIPLRRALVTESDLPYPEGVACAEVLKVGAGPPLRQAASTKPALVCRRWLAVDRVRRVSRSSVATRVFRQRSRYGISALASGVA